MTIVVLIILATISIYAVLGENGLIKKAQQAKDVHEQKTTEEETKLNTLGQYVDDYIPLDENTLTKGPNGKPLITEITKTRHDTITGEDEKGNQVVVPGGFKIASDSGTTVQQGIVIEDASGNQFVWIPVSNINHDGSNKIKLDNNSEVEITLGRYEFNSFTGVETKKQYGLEYAVTTLAAVEAGTVKSYNVSGWYYELTDFREANQVSSADQTNATAKDLAGFINSVNRNKGYYLARYEASYASGTTFGVGNNSTYYKPASKVSTTNSTSSMNYTAGTLWNFITQGNASKASRQMYYGDRYVESDLCNSYAWDTAIIYIQAMENTNYAGQRRGTNTSLKNTGATGDEKCHIFDMAGNTYEWTTEYYNSETKNCTARGGSYYNDTVCTSGRYGKDATDNGMGWSFRVLLYM